MIYKHIKINSTIRYLSKFIIKFKFNFKPNSKTNLHLHKNIDINTNHFEPIRYTLSDLREKRKRRTFRRIFGNSFSQYNFTFSSNCFDFYWPLQLLSLPSLLEISLSFLFFFDLFPWRLLLSVVSPFIFVNSIYFLYTMLNFCLFCYDLSSRLTSDRKMSIFD